MVGADPCSLVGWGATHWMLRESGVWKDRNTDEVRKAQRHSEYAYRLAVDVPAAKELRLFGLSDWVIDRFARHRRQLHDLQWEATRLREKSVIGCLAIVLVANVLVFWRIAVELADGDIVLGAGVTFLQTAFATSSIAFGGLSWALDGASAPVAAMKRLARADGRGRRADHRDHERRWSTVDVRSASATSRSPTRRADATCSAASISASPRARSLAIVGQNGAGKTTLAKLLCRLYDPQQGAIEIDGVDLRDLDIDGWRSRITAVFQDFVRYERSLRDNVAPLGAPDDVIRAALDRRRCGSPCRPRHVLARGYEGGTDLSGGQWQRVALARALCAVRLGAGLVLLDEPTAQLDVRGEAEIFERVLDARRRAARRSWSRIASRRFASPIASASSKAARSSSSARTRA